MLITGAEIIAQPRVENTLHPMDWSWDGENVSRQRDEDDFRLLRIYSSGRRTLERALRGQTDWQDLLGEMIVSDEAHIVYGDHNAMY